MGIIMETALVTATIIR